MKHLKQIALFSLLSMISWNVLADKSTSETIRHVKTTQKVVALTFDDGPSEPYTQQILDVLNKN
ncbi:MAG TPA: polysaccharide deacetylase family protein, partial [Candidatus Berkiella sp.]|nr:polysaccharide deacetylase family protein [Candidatus Berkiella sp.]